MDIDSKRALDLVLAAPALVVAGPILLGVWLAMRVTGDRGPFLYRGERVGRDGAAFRMLKVRTMAAGSRGARITSNRDPRVTPLGRILRRYRVDELPQLVNVVCGEMSLVGPRPEDPRYVDWSDPIHRRVFTAQPGITGLAQLEYHGEARLLHGPDVEEVYRRVVLPAKLALDVEYLDRRSLRLDVEILSRTVRAVLG